MRQPVNRNAQILKNFLDNNADKIMKGGESIGITSQVPLAVAVKKSRHRLSYFERQTAEALGKTVTSDGHIDLSADANRATGIAAGTNMNANFKPATKSLSELMGTEINEENATHVASKAAGDDLPLGAAGRCRQHHSNKPGSFGCPYCKGVGYEKARDSRTAKKAYIRKSLEKQVAELQAELAKRKS
jgi:hypothetical protein